MPTILGEKCKLSMIRTPAGMSQEDRKIYDDWKTTALKEDYDLYFDVGLGAGIPAPPETDPDIARGWFLNTQKRADLIVDTHSEWWIVELRFNASSNAIGRLLMYKKLFLQDQIKTQPIFLILVSDRYDPDLEGLANDNRILYTTTVRRGT